MELKRKLAAVLAADIVGYSKLMAEAEEETLQRLDDCRAIFEEIVGKYRGRIFNTAGDAVLAELPSAVEATRCAIDIQERLAAWNADVPAARKMHVRMGITVGDVFEQGGDLLGDGVNIAARLQAIAAPGGICISRWVHEQVAGKITARFVDRGEQTVKNIPKPVHVFAVEAAGAPITPGGASASKGAVITRSRTGRLAMVAGGAVLASILIGGVGAWMLRSAVSPTKPETTATASSAPSAKPAGFSGVNTAGQPVKSDPARPAPVASASPVAPSTATRPSGGNEPQRPSSPTVSGGPPGAAPSDATAGAMANAPSPGVAPTVPTTPPASAKGSSPLPPASSSSVAALEQRQPVAPQSPKPPVKIGDIIRDCDDCPDMIVLPAGEFLMGSPADEVGREPDEGPQRRIAITAPFATGRGAVTVRQFEAFVRDSGHASTNTCRAFVAGAWAERSDYSFRNPGFPQTPDHPVVCVNWSDATAYAAWLSSKTGARYRLPSEAEREYFTRAGSTGAFWWGDRINPDQANYDATLTYKDAKPGEYRRATRPAVDFEPNLWGISQVHGNVAEWVEDCWNRSYAGAPLSGAAWLSGDCSKRVLRGGAWGYPPKDLRAAYREAVPSGQRFYHVGFRVVRDLSP
jgi:formylglycine-generating enzyme required for sulfatase activity/class 3 adenylate cyclase